MLEEQKTALKQKKESLQYSLKLQSWHSEWAPVFYAIIAIKKPWSFEYFDCVTAAEFSFKETVIRQLTIGENTLTEAIKISDCYYVHDKIMKLYPSSLAMRYLPTLSHHEAYETNTALMLAKAAETLLIKHDEEVFLFYTRFTPVLRVQFSSISLLKEEEIINPEDLCIMALDANWLIFRSLENEWTWGYKNS